MIVIGLGGGLGNQMFQYAFYMSMKNVYPDCCIKMDTRYAFLSEHNGIEIDRVFGVQLNRCTLTERLFLSEAPIPGCWLSKIVFGVRNKLNIHKQTFYKQKDYTEFYSDVYDFESKQNRYMLGVWANEKYLKMVGVRKLREVFTFCRQLNDISIFFKQQILNSNSVSIHVRKGDFVQYGNYIMTDTYYKKAINYLEKTVRNKLDYYVFSDDMEYAKQLFGEENNFHYVFGNEGDDNWMDMCLMSMCKHNIIANSSFSFWGAYLNSNEQKIVIAPSRPFKTCKSPFTCEEWILFDDE